jgi:serine/threonine protein kinase
VIDFGIARAIGGPGLGTLGILGTIGYIAPEQAADESAPDARTDLYALGCLAYELLTGRLPFDGITHKSAPLDVLEAHRMGQPRPVLEVRPHADPELADLIMRLLSRDPSLRPVSAGSLIAPLHTIRSRCSAGIAYAVDIPTPTFSDGQSFSHEDVLTDHHLLGETVANVEGALPANWDSGQTLGAEEGVDLVGYAPTIGTDQTSAPPAMIIPPPLHDGSMPPGPSTPVVPGMQNGQEWSLGDADTSRPPKDERKGGRLVLLGPVAALVIGVCALAIWFFRS